jgi:outer membrane usher protein
MPRCLRRRGGRALVAVAVLLVAGLDAQFASALPDPKSLQLEVVVNNAPTNLIGKFFLLDDGRIASTRGELDEIGLKTDEHQSADGLVILDDLSSVRYRYDEPGQKIFITVSDAQRKAREYNANGAPAERVAAQAGYGAVLNYDLLNVAGKLTNASPFTFNGTSLTLDGRAFSPYGTLSQSAIARETPGWQGDLLRLDTTYRFSDQDRLVDYRAGDTITGGLPWTRPIRIGGIQAQRDFRLRSDLITAPLPTLGGTAAVPSTVDVYVNNIKTFSQDVASGPFTLTNVPMVSGAGDARIDIRDASGHQTSTIVPFYMSPNMLAPGLTSFSAEVGLPRLGYGTAADVYMDTPVASATLRRGIHDWLTLEGHAEAGDGLANAGIGAVARTGQFGVASAAVSMSHLGKDDGLQGYLAYETKLFGINLSASAQHTMGSYDDLASATARYQPTPVGLPNIVEFFPYVASPNAVGLSSMQLWTSARPPQALDRITASLPVPFDRNASVGLSFIRLRDALGNASNIATASWSRTLPFHASIDATVFTDVDSRRNAGIFVGLSVPLFGSATASTSVSSGPGGTTVNTEVVQQLGAKPGSTGWRVHDSEGTVEYREASLSYRSDFARAQVGAAQGAGNATGMLEVDGAIATMGGGVFFANRIDDAFAVVNVGAPKVPVFYENRPVGLTDADGRILVPNLRSYDKNKISFDPTDLPVDAEIGTTRNVVAPADRAGVFVDFRVHTDTSSALVVLVHPDGTFVPVGSVGEREGSEEFIVGYDGQAFIKNLAARNAVRIVTPKGTCRAQFDFSPQANTQVVISPVVCRGKGEDGPPPLRPAL